MLDRMWWYPVRFMRKEGTLRGTAGWDHIGWSKTWCAGWCDSMPNRGRLRQVDRKYPTQSIGDSFPIERMKVRIIPVLFLSCPGHGCKVWQPGMKPHAKGI